VGLGAVASAALVGAGLGGEPLAALVGGFRGKKGIGLGIRSEPSVVQLHHLLSEFQVRGGGRKGG